MQVIPVCCLNFEAGNTKTIKNYNSDKINKLENADDAQLD